MNKTLPCDEYVYIILTVGELREKGGAEIPSLPRHPFSSPKYASILHAKPCCSRDLTFLSLLYGLTNCSVEHIHFHDIKYIVLDHMRMKQNS